MRAAALLLNISAAALPLVGMTPAKSSCRRGVERRAMAAFATSRSDDRRHRALYRGHIDTRLCVPTLESLATMSRRI
jgi:hypothetical protein